MSATPTRSCAEAVERVARGLLALGLEPGERVGIWAPNCTEWALVQFATAKLGIILVNINPAYRTSELEYALRQSGCRALISAQSFKTSDYARWSRSVRGDLPELEQVVLLDRRLGGAARRGHRTRRVASAATPVRRPDQHPVHERHHGLPQGRHAQPPQHPQQRLLRRRGLPLHEQDRVCIPVPFYHCFGMVMGNLGCTTHGACMVIPEAAFDPRRRFGRSRTSAAPRSTACPTDVHRRARAPGLRVV
jgi:fatty-acyl-CoA synthase